MGRKVIVKKKNGGGGGATTTVKPKSAMSMAIKGTRVAGKGGKGKTTRVKVVTPSQAQLKRLLKLADTLPDIKPKAKVKKVVVKKAVKPKGVKARGLSIIKKRLARLKNI